MRDHLIFKVKVDPTNAQIAYAATQQGVQKTKDGGNTWISLGQKTAFVFSLAVDPQTRSTVYLGGPSGGLYKSIDGGQTWQNSNANLPATNIYALAIDPQSGAIYASLEGEGVYKKYRRREYLDGNEQLIAEIGAADFPDDPQYGGGLRREQWEWGVRQF